MKPEFLNIRMPKKKKKQLSQIQNCWCRCPAKYPKERNRPLIVWLMEVWVEANPSCMTESGFRLQPFPAGSQFNKSRLLSSYRFLNRFESKSPNDTVPTVTPDILELRGLLSLFLYNTVQSSNVFLIQRNQMPSNILRTSSWYSESISLQMSIYWFMPLFDQLQIARTGDGAQSVRLANQSRWLLPLSRLRSANPNLISTLTWRSAALGQKVRFGPFLPAVWT